jgi:hypothetical protein
MLRSAKRAGVVIGLAVLSLSVLSSQTKPDNYFARAKQFIRAMYPGLDGNLRVVLTDENRLREPDSTDPDSMNHMLVQLYDLEPKRGESQPPCWCAAPTLSARLLFDWQTQRKELLQVVIGGSAIESRSKQFNEQLAKRALTSDAEIIKAMSEYGAKFPPSQKSAFLRFLPLAQLKAFTGEVEVVSAEFNLRQLDADGRHSTAEPRWTVRGAWHGPERQVRTCTMVFEPFDGNLMSFRRDL